MTCELVVRTGNKFEVHIGLFKRWTWVYSMKRVTDHYHSVQLAFAVPDDAMHFIEFYQVLQEVHDN